MLLKIRKVTARPGIGDVVSATLVKGEICAATGATEARTSKGKSVDVSLEFF